MEMHKKDGGIGFSILTRLPVACYGGLTIGRNINSPVDFYRCAGEQLDEILNLNYIVVLINSLSLYIVQTGCPLHNF